MQIENVNLKIICAAKIGNIMNAAKVMSRGKSIGLLFMFLKPAN